MDYEFDKQDQRWIEAYRMDCQNAADQPAHVWAAQRARIHARIGSTRETSSLRIALATIAALLVIASGLLISQPTSPAPKQPIVAQQISDQQLLADIDDTLANPLPDALAPVELISQDLDRSLQASEKKETR